MKNATTKSAFHRGFTLIELMIVIVILGILMGTILPRLSGAQSRARDTARMADLNTIAQAMEVYYDDFGNYPEPANGEEQCLTGADFPTFATYFKGENIPTPPQGETTRLSNDIPNHCEGSYMYLPLVNRSTPYQGYAIVANVEIPAKGNFITDNAGGGVTVPGTALTFSGVNPPSDPTPSNTTVSDVLDHLDAYNLPDDMNTAEGEDDTGMSTLYMLVSGG